MVDNSDHTRWKHKWGWHDRGCVIRTSAAHVIGLCIATEQYSSFGGLDHMEVEVQDREQVEVREKVEARETEEEDKTRRDNKRSNI